jgi:general secretion pathway protein D
VNAQLSGAISVTLQAENIQDLFSATPIKIKFDPKQLRLNDITPGELLSRDGQKVNVARDIRNDAGEASVTLTRLPGSTGISGTGALATFTFTAIGKGTATVTLSDFGLKDSQQQPIVVTAPELPVTIQ